MSATGAESPSPTPARHRAARHGRLRARRLGGAAPRTDRRWTPNGTPWHDAWSGWTSGRCPRRWGTGWWRTAACRPPGTPRSAPGSRACAASCATRRPGPGGAAGDPSDDGCRGELSLADGQPDETAGPDDVHARYAAVRLGQPARAAGRLPSAACSPGTPTPSHARTGPRWTGPPRRWRNGASRSTRRRRTRRPPGHTGIRAPRGVPGPGPWPWPAAARARAHPRRPDRPSANSPPVSGRSSPWPRPG
ncbi:hypothetical protein ACFQ3Z_38985 [Streptomyces nogalater]